MTEKEIHIPKITRLKRADGKFSIKVTDEMQAEFARLYKEDVIKRRKEKEEQDGRLEG